MSNRILSVSDIARMIDHSLVRPDLTDAEVMAGCRKAAEYHTQTVFVRPYDVRLAKEALAGTDVGVSTGIAFPHGASTTRVKVYEVECAMADGATELDVVIAISKVKSGAWDYVRDDLRAVADAIHARGGIIKVIFETCYLTDAEIIRACEVCEAIGADYVKTSTGYGPAGATLEHVRLMRASVSPRVSVKAAGGIRTLDQVLQYRAAGAKMIGTRSTVEIMQEAMRRAEAGTLVEVAG